MAMSDFLTEKQQENLRFFNSKLGEMLENPIYKHKFTLVCNKEIQGIYDTFENALTSAVSKFQPGEYVIQQIISEKEVSGFIFSALVPA